MVRQPRRNTLMPPESDEPNARGPARRPPGTAAILTSAEEAEVRLRVAYAHAVNAMGEKATRQILQELQKKPHGRPKGTTDQGRDDLLLHLYDWGGLYNEDRLEPGKGTARQIGENLHKICPGMYGNSAKAISAQVLRLVNRRAVEDAARRAELREEAGAVRPNLPDPPSARRPSQGPGVGDRPWRPRTKRSSLHASRRRDREWLVADWLSARRSAAPLTVPSS